MRYASIAILGLALVACSSVEPVPINAGDVCTRCGRTITDTRLGGEIVSADGKTSVFRTPGCMAKYLKDNPAGVKAIYVTDYPTGKLISVSNALFVRTKIDDTTGEKDYVAYRSATEAAARAKDDMSAAVDWSTVRTLAGAEKGN